MTKKQILGIIAFMLSLLIAISVFAGCNSTSAGEALPEQTEAKTSETEDKTNEEIKVEVKEELASPHTEYIKAQQESFEMLFPVSAGIKDYEFDEDSLVQEISITKFNGKSFDAYEDDMGDGSYMYVAEGATLQQFSDFLVSLTNKGAAYYTSNKIGANFFVTLATKKQIITAMYLKSENEVRVVVDDRARFDLAGLSDENEYQSLGRGSLTMVAIEETGWPGGLGMVYELTDGSFIIIDGGYSNRNVSTGAMTVSSANWLTKTLKKLAKDPDNIRIAAWVITHPHRDHYGAFIEMAKSSECLADIHIEKMIYNNPAAEYIKTDGVDVQAEWIDEAIVKWDPDQIIKAHPGQVIFVRDAVITVYGAPDITVPCAETITDANHLDVVTMIDFRGKRGLYMGDASSLQNPIIGRIFKKDLKADILQLAHHGYGDTKAGEVYKYVDPSIIFWPVGTRDYPGCANVAFNRGFFEDSNDNHVALKENLTIKDFTTWQPEPRWDPTK